MMKPLSRLSRTDMAAQSIRSSILNGSYQVGDKRATEQQLCEELQVSRTVVREALRILSAEGYVHIYPGRGAFVEQIHEIPSPESRWSALSPSDFMDLMAVRIPMEELAVRLAAERSSEELVPQLEANYARFLTAIQSGDYEEMIRLDAQFHMLIFRATGNELLISIGRQLSKVLSDYRYASFTDKETYANAIEPHDRIIQAFRSGDPEAAVAAMHDHMMRAKSDISTRISD